MIVGNTNAFVHVVFSHPNAQEILWPLCRSFHIQKVTKIFGWASIKHSFILLPRPDKSKKSDGRMDGCHTGASYNAIYLTSILFQESRRVLGLFFRTVKGGLHVVFIWSVSQKKLGEKLFVFLLCPLLGESLKGDKACQRQSLHMLQLSAHIWHRLVTSAKAGKEVTTRLSRCNLSLWGAQICWRWIGEAVLCNTEIGSAASEEAHLSTGYWESDCDNEVIKRWQWGIPANGKQHPGASHLLRLLCVLIVRLIFEGSGQVSLLCLM